MSTPNKSFKPLFELTISLDREVNETNTRVEDGKTITETVKVKRSLNVPICLKSPSRAEREEAEIVRASWVNRYEKAGLMLEAMLIKKYVDEGGTLPSQYQAQYQDLQNRLFELERQIQEKEILDRNDLSLRDLRAEFFDVREEMIAIQKTQAQFFEDTAEAKARLKKIEWIVLNLSYYRPVNSAGEPGEWTPFFAGDTTEAKLDVYDAMIEAVDPLLAKAKTPLTFMAAALAHEGAISKEDIESYAASLKDVQTV